MVRILFNSKFTLTSKIAWNKQCRYKEGWLYVMIAHTLNMCAPYMLCTFDNIFEIVELRHYYRRLHHLWIAYIVYLCVICNSNRFHSFIFKLGIMIVNTLKMCTGDVGPEQSLVLFHILVLQVYWVLMENRIPLKLVLGGIRIIALSISSHEQTQ